MRTKFSGILTLLLVLVVQLSFAQQKTITGTVADDSGLPLPGANVIVKGTSNGTQTDFDGKYSISASVGQTLTYSYVGFETTEQKVGASNSVNVTMKPGATLNEVVITGFSNRNQTVQTSAVVTISASEISELAPTTSVDNLLQGKAAGVQVTSANGKPGQGAFVRIRGTGSLVAGASSPLYIVDGAPIREEELGGLSNEDIENITILKDAATTARYGSRGANGVVVITTKNGNRNKDATIRFSSRYGTTSRINPNFELMDAQQKFRYEAELYALGVLAAGNLPGVTTEPGSPERQRLLDNETDWEDLILRDGVIQNNSVSISGGAEKMDYFFSVTNDRNTGIIDEIGGFERLSSRLNVNFDAKKWLTVGVNIGYSRSTSDEPRDRNNLQNPFRAPYDTNNYETEFVLDEDNNVVLDANGNPVYNITHGNFAIRKALLTDTENTIENLTLANVDATVKFSDSFTYTFSTSVSHLNRRRETYSREGGALDDAIDLDGGSKGDNGIQRLDLTISNRLNYYLASEAGHNLNILGLYEFNFNENNAYSLGANQFASPLLSTQINGTNTRGDTNRNRLTLVSYGAFADYDYKERYLASASIRRDGSSNFGIDNRFGTFYSFSAGWNIAKESFFNSDAINDLKLRASYGTVGNRLGIGRYDNQNTVAFGNSPYPGGPATAPSNIGNPDLKWETTITKNIGLEFSLFNSRIKGVADYFIRNTEDLLFNVPAPTEAGIGSIAANVGEIQNKGLELSLQTDVIRSSDFTWTLGGNIIFLDNEIISLPDGEDVTPFAFNILFREGAKINEHYLIRYAGVDPATGRPQYFGGDNNIYYADELPEGENRVLQGKSTIADKEGGFFNNFNYKGFGLRTDFVFKYGNWINNIVKQNSYGDISNGNTVADNKAVGAFNYWKQPGDTDVLPSPLYINEQDINSDRFLERGDYIRMRNITLSYTFPNEFLEKTPISSLRIYAQGQNLLTFTKFWGDPEVGLSSGESIAFADTVAPGETTLYSYPNTKSIQVGLNVSF